MYIVKITKLFTSVQFEFLDMSSAASFMELALNSIVIDQSDIENDLAKNPMVTISYVYPKDVIANV